MMKKFYNLLVLVLRNTSSNAILKKENETRGSHSVFTRNRFIIQRDHIIEDAFNQLNVLSEYDLRGLI